MSEQWVNFLPESYLAQRRERSRSWRWRVVIGAAVLAMAGWGAWTQQWIGTKADIASQLKRDIEDVEFQKEQFIVLSKQRTALEKTWRLRERLNPGLTATQTIAALTPHLPKQVNLMRLSLQTRGMEIRSASDVRPVTRHARTATTISPHVRVDIEALAPGESTIADMLTSLNNQKLFRGVVLHYSQPTIVRNAHAREFRLEVQAPADRRYAVVYQDVAAGDAQASDAAAQGRRDETSRLAQVEQGGEVEHE